MSGKYRLVVVDDHALFRRGLISLLEEMPEFDVVGEASDGEEALKVIAQRHPDIALVDVNMPRMDGIALVQALRRQKSALKVLMLTISQEDQDLIGAIRAGANGYILKNTEPEDLRKALLNIAEGKGVLSPEVVPPVLGVMQRGTLDSSPQLLSDRELEVLQCLAEGLTTQQIASRLFISENTVKTHIRHILDKLEASNRTEAVGKATQLGILRR
ncbi:response regulator [Anaerolinea thermophila]|uniref:NarL family two-component response regulator n=1 Tax=Anaerolinea thermophila (strain DSM 14523 / JCM 11388 / NBRC 100420 / UNI-1) TaxID=926569 RepID=E8N0S0_ANATU|nr:response regulator transcription factor [Anaerolinea thermophila]BAJ62465.1 NarL family two-component response regulator [Anaerolinea thermophila UNI-1]